MKAKLFHVVHSTTEKETYGSLWIQEAINPLFECSSLSNLLSNSEFLMGPRASRQADLGPHDQEDPMVRGKIMAIALEFRGKSLFLFR